jgi:arsenical pump membrane protein
VLTVFTSNDIIVLTFTPFICFFARRAGISPMPYLFAEFVAANTWSMALVIGNPTNIYLASSAGIDFISYLAKMAIPTLLAGLTSYGLLVLLFRKQLKAPLVAGEASEERVENKIALILGVAHLALCTILLTVSSYLGWEMWLIAAGFALSLAACALVLAAAKKTPVCYLTGAVKRLPYELIPFVLSMFAIVLALNASGVTAQLGSLLAKLPQPFGYGVSSFLAANVINNIPMSVLFSDLLLAGGAEISAVYAAIIGSNLGAYFTPVGALAGIMWMTILKRFNVNLSFAKFIRYGVIISMPALAAALLGLVIVF